MSARGEEALRHAIAAAELYMQATSRAKTPAERSRLRLKVTELLDLGERLKANARLAAATSRPPVPESTRTLTTPEKTVILKASRLHGSVFPPWGPAPGPETFRQADGPGGAYMCVQDTTCGQPANGAPVMLTCCLA